MSCLLQMQPAAKRTRRKQADGDDKAREEVRVTRRMATAASLTAEVADARSTRQSAGRAADDGKEGHGGNGRADSSPMPCHPEASLAEARASQAPEGLREDQQAVSARPKRKAVLGPEAHVPARAVKPSGQDEGQSSSSEEPEAEAPTCPKRRLLVLQSPTGSEDLTPLRESAATRPCMQAEEREGGKGGGRSPRKGQQPHDGRGQRFDALVPRRKEGEDASKNRPKHASCMQRLPSLNAGAGRQQSSVSPSALAPAAVVGAGGLSATAGEGAARGEAGGSLSATQAVGVATPLTSLLPPTAASGGETGVNQVTKIGGLGSWTASVSGSVAVATASTRPEATREMAVVTTIKRAASTAVFQAAPELTRPESRGSPTPGGGEGPRPIHSRRPPPLSSSLAGVQATGQQTKQQQSSRGGGGRPYHAGSQVEEVHRGRPREVEGEMREGRGSRDPPEAHEQNPPSRHLEWPPSGSRGPKEMETQQHHGKQSAPLSMGRRPHHDARAGQGHVGAKDGSQPPPAPPSAPCSRLGHHWRCRNLARSIQLGKEAARVSRGRPPRSSLSPSPRGVEELATLRWRRPLSASSAADRIIHQERRQQGPQVSWEKAANSFAAWPHPVLCATPLLR